MPCVPLCKRKKKLQSKLRAEGEVRSKTHLDQIRPTSRKDAPAGASSSKGNDAVEVNSRYGGSYSVFLSFRAHSIALEERLPHFKVKNGKRGSTLIPFFSLSVQTQ